MKLTKEQLRTIESHLNYRELSHMNVKRGQFL